MKSSFFVEVNQVKNQLLNETDSASASRILERLILQQQEQISSLREQLDRKDKVIDKLLEKLERRDKAGKLKSDTCDVTISELIIRMENPDLDKKRIEVNKHLKEMCKEKNIFLIDHGKRIKANHLNSSKIHLNWRGDTILSNTFIKHISKVFK